MNNLSTALNVLVGLFLLAALAYFGWSAAVEFVKESPEQTLAYAGFGGLVVSIVGVGSALLSPRRM